MNVLHLPAASATHLNHIFNGLAEEQGGQNAKMLQLLLLLLLLPLGRGGKGLAPRFAVLDCIRHFSRVYWHHSRPQRGDPRALAVSSGDEGAR